MRTAVIDGGNHVANVIEADPDFAMPGFLLVVSDTAGPGDAYDTVAGTFSRPEPVLKTERLAKTNAVMAMRESRIEGGFTFEDVRYQSRGEDRENIAGAAQLGFMALVAGVQAGDLRWANPDEDFLWIAEDNDLVAMDAPTVVSFGKAAAGFKQACIFAAFALKAAIENAPDLATLEAIDLTQGWPA